MSRRARWLLTGVVSATLASSAGLAQAQPTPTSTSPVSSSDSDARRSALYRDGVTFADAGRWEEAVAKFREVVAIRSAPPALFTLGQAEEHVGHYVSAKRAYARAQVDAHAAGTHDVAEAAQKALTAVEAHIARLTIRPVPSDGASATIDGAPAPVEQPVEVDPGDHQVTVTAPSRPAYGSRVHLTDGERQEMSAVLGDATNPVATPIIEASTTRAFPVGPVVVGGIGIVAGIIGIIVNRTGQSSFDAASAKCSAMRCASPSAVNEGNSARSQILAGDVVLGIGIAAVAGAATWWLVAPKKSASGPTVGLDVVPGLSGLRTRVTVDW